MSGSEGKLGACAEVIEVVDPLRVADPRRVEQDRFGELSRQSAAKTETVELEGTRPDGVAVDQALMGAEDGRTGKSRQPRTMARRP